MAKKSKKERLLSRLEQLQVENAQLKRQLAGVERQPDPGEDVNQAELHRMRTELKALQAQVEQAEQQAREDLFRQMVSSPAKRGLRKLIAFGEDDEPGWLAPLARYMRDELGLRLLGKAGERLTLTLDNRDDYQLNDRVELPCEVRITIRGIAINETVLLRPEVSPAVEDE
ncbi:MAG: hypothetical protein GYB68_05395 [Chloroflexi bacterium]|nr:hypothetical protein [Chloroflexota bacterium]